MVDCALTKEGLRASEDEACIEESAQDMSEVIDVGVDAIGEDNKVIHVVVNTVPAVPQDLV